MKTGKAAVLTLELKAETKRAFLEEVARVAAEIEDAEVRRDLKWLQENVGQIFDIPSIFRFRYVSEALSEIAHRFYAVAKPQGGSPNYQFYRLLTEL